ncbi:hypothetical protein GW17_00052711 [Ensete ventricosum]|nr:hypothetical protein GW17_00052711 [Ensete ventricosum]
MDLESYAMALEDLIDATLEAFEVQSLQISGFFHDLSQELATWLDVFPVDNLHLIANVHEQIKLLRRQCRRSKLCLDSNKEDP